MLTREENELLTRTGPGTPMGNLMRQYWIPALLSKELPNPDCTPVRTLLLGERLIAFRDSENRVGLLADACPHRGVSLFFGLNENRGLRCAFHGWKFDVNGRCVDMPHEPQGETLKCDVRAKAYPCRERAGIIWAYMGPREVPPPLPEIKFGDRSESEIAVGASLVECNWLQVAEFSLDFFHLRHLHSGPLSIKRKQRQSQGLPIRDIEWLSRTPESRLECADTEYGVAFAACEELQPGGNLCWGIGQFRFPFYANLPDTELGSHWMVGQVPMDDYHTLLFGFVADGGIVNDELHLGPGPFHAADDSGWLGRHRMRRNSGNDYLLDREAQRDVKGPGAWCGILGQGNQDVAIAAAAGPLVDRTAQHLVPSDAAVVRVRKRLIESAHALAEKGTPPPGVDNPSSCMAKHGSIVLPRGASWLEALKNSGR